MTHTAVRTPAAVFPPGDFLREELAARGWSQAELARRMDNVRVSHTHVAHVLAGDGGISFALARGLALALGTSASFWLDLQMEWDVARRGTELDALVAGDIAAREAAGGTHDQTDAEDE